MILKESWLNISNMMTELSLNILDVAYNSIKANASLVEITVQISHTDDMLMLIIKDNGRGMTREQLSKVEDPFYTTRTTRKVGLGIPFLKMAAELAGGSFRIESSVGKGTSVIAEFELSHIDRIPLGDICSTIHTLITMNPEIDFLYTYEVDLKSFQLDTRSVRKILGSIPLDAPEVSSFIMEYLSENQNSVDSQVS